MHDLQTINKINREAVLNAAEAARDKGNHVAVVFQGLNAERFKVLDTAEEAIAFGDKVCSEQITARVRYLHPNTNTAAA
jgi:hypothetical protein